MKLVSVHVRKFQNILDSTEVKIEGDLTCLVGKNESGKTAFLRALYRLNPAYEEKFDPSQDYPRWDWRRDEKNGVVERTAPIVATFELGDDDVAAVEAVLGAGCIPSRTVRWGRSYANRELFSIDLDEQATVRHLVEGLVGSAALKKRASAATTLEQLKEVLSPVDVGSADELESRDREEGPSARTQGRNRRLLDQAAELADPEARRRTAHALLKDRFPTFFYFSEYSKLPGRFPLGKLLAADPDDLDEDERTARALLELAGGRGEHLAADDYDRRVAELEASANEITRQVFEYWSQNRELRVEFDVDTEIETDASGATRVRERYLDVRVYDGRHHFTTNFEARSSGFQWFFSFVTALSEYQGTVEPLIVLLDEPGLNLHPRAQSDLMRYMGERLAADHQVLYTTHSPFMIEASTLRRVRLVEDQPQLGGIVSSDALASERDTVFPLQAALAYDVAQNMFVGAQNLVMKGSSDYMFISSLSGELDAAGREHLDPSVWTIVPMGGAIKLPAFVALLGTKLNATVLIDSDANVNQELNDMVVKELLKAERMITIGQLTGQQRADLEDLFEVNEYLGLYNAAFTSTITANDLVGTEEDPIVKRIERLTGFQYDRGAPAQILLREPERQRSLSAKTLARFERLFQMINGTAG
jgi:energy-coupling factor transporter ATP-binding protein EcfA2